ncbi:MAG: flagellar hook-associated protein FlgK [Lachnospiraceae bacterium]|nr:flagellar hook-associated protein FlgK [Lachnospiraceae bacterium]
MSLFGSLYVGASGLQTGQHALNTVAHNLSNADTVGYTRQQTLLNDRQYNTLSVNPKGVANQQIGLGVTYADVRQVRDVFLDQTYRRESGRSAFYEVSYNTLTEIETLLGELEGESFSHSLNNLWEAVQELAKQPASSVTQGLLIQRSSQFVEQATNVYGALCNYQDNLNVQLKGEVDKINTFADRLYKLNNDIIRIEAGGIERANDLRDERNKILDELGKLGNIDYTEDQEGGLMVKFEGHVLVNRAMTFKIEMDTDPETGFYTPFWLTDAKKILQEDGTYKYLIDNCKVYDMSRVISTAANTDIGSLKGMMLARGTHRADYTDLHDAKQYNDEVASSVLMNVMAEFDNLIHNIVSEMNQMLEDAAVKEGGTYLRNEDGTIIQLFERIGCDEYDAAGNLVREDTSPGQENTLLTISNLVVNPALVKEPTKLGFIKMDAKEDYEIAQNLQLVFETAEYRLNPNVATKTNLIDYYSNLVSQVANTGSVFYSIYSNEQATVDSTEYARQQIVGVSDDEELNNMIKFQNAYNASSRYINVIDEMLEHILNTLGA